MPEQDLPAHESLKYEPNKNPGSGLLSGFFG